MGEGDERTQRTQDTVEPRTRRTLVLRGVLPDDDTCILLDTGRRVLGRDPKVEARIDRSRVSRRHAELYCEGPIFSLRDLGSTNGTYLNGKPIQHAVVRPGSVLRIGDFLGVFEELAPTEQGVRFGELAPGLFGGPLLARALGPLRAVRAELPVVLIGETGTGKERFARAVHDFSGVRGPFHAMNSAAIPTGLAEGELFGYERGAFTGAQKKHLGQLRAAHGGTLFIDEIAELPLNTQAKLLRALELRQVVPLGDTRSFSFEARVVVATQTPLPDLVLSGTFRRDLAARLSGIIVQIPALAERRGDVPGLFDQFLRQTSSSPPAVSTRLYEQLCLHSWPANVRELVLLARQLLAQHGSEPLLRRSHLPDTLRGPEEATPEPRENFESRRSRDFELFSRALEHTGGNVKLAAEKAGISRQRAYRLMQSENSTAHASGTAQVSHELSE